MENPVQEEFSKKENLLRTTATLSGTEKIARVLMLLDQEEAVRFLREFSDEEVQRIAQAMLDIRDIPPEQKEFLLQELKQPVGGKGTAQKILESAFGKNKSQTILQKVETKTENASFQFLENMDINAIMLALENESTLTISLLLTQISPAKASKILQRLSSSEQRKIAKRIAEMQQINTQVAHQLSTQLRHKLQHIDTNPMEIDGTAHIARILRYIDMDRGQNILQELSPDLSQKIAQRIFSPDIVYDIEDSHLQDFFREQDDKDIAVFLHKKPPTIVHKVLKNLSQRRKILIKEEMTSLHASPRKIMKGTRNLLDTLQKWVQNKGVPLLSPEEREEIHE